MLAEHKGHQNRTPLGFASMNGQLNVVEELIQNWKVNINSKDQFLSTPLILAVEYNQLSVVSYLLKKVADVNAKDEYGKDAMERATEKENQEIIDLIQNYCP